MLNRKFQNQNPKALKAYIGDPNSRKTLKILKPSLARGQCQRPTESFLDDLVGCHLIDLGIHMGSWQNYGPSLGTLNMRCRIILRTQSGTIILTTTHMGGGGAFLKKARLR